MQSSNGQGRLRFDLAARIVSVLSLLSSTASLLVFFLAPDRGIDFRTHIDLCFALVGQLAMFLVFVIIGVLLAGFGTGLRLTRFGTVLILIATAALVAQCFAVQNVSVDGSTVP